MSAFIAGIVLLSFLLSRPILHRSSVDPERMDSGTSTLATRSPAAKESDAKPVCDRLYELVCTKHGATRDPSGSVQPGAYGEIEALHIYEDIIGTHADWSLDQVDEELARQIYTPKRVNRIQFAHRTVLHAIDTILDHESKSSFTAHEKKILKKRLHATELQLPPPASNYQDEPDLFTKNDVFYERTSDGKMRMRVGGAYLLSAKSWFNLIFTIAHELGHSIDPCEVRAEGLAFPAYDRLSACFVHHNLVAMRKDRTECGNNDQLSETFADWLAVQVTAEVLKNFATEFKGQQILNAVVNSVRDLCDDEFEEADMEFHPSPQVRIDRIFGKNPAIRELLGCGVPESGRKYCGFDSTF